MPSEGIDLRNFKRAVLAAPVLLFAAHFGCSSPNKKEPPPTPSQTSDQQLNLIATQTPFSEQFDWSTPQTPQAIPEKPTSAGVSNKYEIIKIPLPRANDAPYYEPDGYFIYKGIGYKDLLGNLDKLKQVYLPSTFSQLTQLIMDAKRLDTQNPNSQDIMTNINSAGNIIRGSCERNKYSREYMRLLASLVYEKYPATNDKYRLGFFELYIIDCEIFGAKL